MAESEQTVAVLFVDICGSTALFEESGNLRALGMIGECLDELGSVAGDYGGTIIRSKGDDLLCTFPDTSDALRCALEMIGRELEGGLQIHIAIHYGAVINARGDIFGDAVNVAARMLELANPGEILVSEDFATTLSKIEQREMRLLEQRLVKGKSDPMGIYAVVSQDPDSTQVYVESGEPALALSGCGSRESNRARLTLLFKDRQITCDETQAALILGRSARCDLVIGEACVSREHATIRVEQGKVVLTDRSSTGTYIQPSGERALLVRREAVPLIGSGVLSLGRLPDPHEISPGFAREYLLWLGQSGECSLDDLAQPIVVLWVVRDRPRCAV